MFSIILYKTGTNPFKNSGLVLTRGLYDSKYGSKVDVLWEFSIFSGTSQSRFYMQLRP